MRERLSAQATRGYVTYDGAGHFTLPDEHAIPLTDETSPACAIGAFETALGAVYATDTIADRFGTGDGFAWGAHDQHVLGGCERFFRPGYLNNLTSTWIPALSGIESKLQSGGKIADVGCGHGASDTLSLRLTRNRRLLALMPIKAPWMRHESEPKTRDWPSASTSTSPRPRLSRVRTTLSAFSTACTTWVIPLVPARMSKSSLLRTAHSCSSSRSRATI